MTCHGCEQDNGFLIRGLCEACSPEAHKRHHGALMEVDRAIKAYEIETGRSALKDYEAFDMWVKAGEGR